MTGARLGADRRGFEAFYAAHFARVVGAAYLMTGSREEARDLAQETFARAYERWETVSRYEEPGAWLQRVVTNLATSWRRRQRLRARETIAESTVPSPDVPEPAILRALLRLTPAQRAVIVLRFYADQSVAQVSKILGKRPGTVRALTSQGLSRLREAAELQGVRP
jgi:RNA polymerase sigma-70 factor, ECF subfamily